MVGTITQIKRPVSRLTEKVLGWLCWVMLLVLTVITMFIALVSFSNNTSIANLENTLNNNAFIQQLLAGNGYNTTQFVIIKWYMGYYRLLYCLFC